MPKDRWLENAFEVRNDKTDRSFTMADSNSFFKSLGNSSDNSRKQIFRGILGNLFYHENVCCVYSLKQF